MLEALFNVAPQRLADARLEFALPAPALALLVVCAVLATLAASGYLGVRRRRSLVLLRAALAVLALLILAGPVLVLPAPDATQAPVLVLLDDTRSMSIGDGPGGEPRGAFMAREFAPGEGGLARALEARFDTRYLRYAAAAAPIAPGAPAPAFAGAVSDPLGALLDVTSGAGLAGVVLVGDGGQVTSRDREDAITRLRAAGVPVHVVGVGSPRPQPDVGVSALGAPAAVLPGDTVDLQVSLAAAGFDGAAVRVSVRDAGVLLGSAEVTIARDTALASIPVRLDQPGLRQLEVQVAAPAGDRIAGNDADALVVQVREQAARVLHFEGEPRFEVKFLRRALAEDRALELSSLVRTGDNRFLRLGTRDAQELASGFPADAPALFRYHVLVLGSAEAAAFSAGQLELLEAFVARRGGSLLLLGGRNALAEGGFAGTPIADLAPVRLDPPALHFRAAAVPVITRDGGAHPVIRGLFDGASRAGALLPALAVVNPVREAKPGASVLLLGDDGSASPLVMLAWHRYGRGRVAVLPVRDTWRWRMHADMLPGDRTHELFWRRLLRWLAREVPERVAVAAQPASAAPGQAVRILVQVHDEDFRPASNASPQLRAITPLGDIEQPALRWRAGQDGAYAGELIVAEAGVYALAATAGADAAAHDTGRLGLRVAADGEEFRAAGLDDALLRRIAHSTGGSYRHAGAVSDLAARVAGAAPPSPVWQRVPLWNAPALLLAMLALMCAEWWLRRRGRLA